MVTNHEDARRPLARDAVGLGQDAEFDMRGARAPLGDPERDRRERARTARVAAGRDDAMQRRRAGKGCG